MISTNIVRRLGMIGVTLVLSGAMAWPNETLAIDGASEFDPVPAGRLISALDASIQERFKEVNERLGIRRVIRIGETPHVFRPEDASELSAVEGLEEANLRVVLYLTGRRVQGAKPDTSQSSAAEAWRLIKGPVAITPTLTAMGTATSGNPQAPPPSSLELWDESRRALEVFARSDSHEFNIGRWRFIAKPVRASDANCLECHDDSGATILPRSSPVSPVQLGDALGVLLYGYQPR